MVLGGWLLFLKVTKLVSKYIDGFNFYDVTSIGFDSEWFFLLFVHFYLHLTCTDNVTYSCNSFVASF